MKQSTFTPIASKELEEKWGKLGDICLLGLMQKESHL